MPTPRPTIDPITVAQLGMSTTYATRDREPAPTARPSSAVPIGRPIATSGPEGEQQDHDRDQQAERLADAGGSLLEREVQVAAGLDPQRRRARGGRRGAS